VYVGESGIIKLCMKELRKPGIIATGGKELKEIISADIDENEKLNRRGRCRTS
jgi:hypothetical protein